MERNIWIDLLFILSFGVITFCLGMTVKEMTIEIPECNPVLECPSCLRPICMSSVVNVSCPQPVCPVYGCEVDYSSHFQAIITGLCEERPYDYEDDNWNCDEMSKELKDRLNNAGYKCKVVYGRMWDGGKKSGHAWLECTIKVESSSCQIAHANRYKDYTRW